MEFVEFSQLIHLRFNELSKHELFVTVPGDELWAHYLASFPEGSNPIFRERTDHDCSCCRNFIKNLGNVVAINNGRLHSVWSDVDGKLGFPYDVVAKEMAAFVEGHPITSLFRTKERSYGAAQTLEHLANGNVKKWNHFHGAVDNKHFSKTPDQIKGEFNTTAALFKRGLVELSPSAFSTVVDLIEANNLYRGQEFLSAIKGFQDLQKRFNKLTDPAARDLFIWANATNPATRFRNTAIGTLIQDLSAGMDLEAAVRSFESKVAPTNYKRTTALITPAMVNQAMETINGLGLESALERRFARLSDVSVNNVLWVDNSVQSQMKDGIAGLLMGAAVPKQKGEAKAEDITMDEFMAKVVPLASSMEVFFKNAQQNNLMSLTAPVHADVAHLFKWNNNFGWSYNGNITDSIKEKVKRAGGNTNAKLRVSLAWFNPDDLDIHCHGPEGHVYYADRKGILDVDMNGMDRYSATDPVENLSWKNPKDGQYRISVNQYSRRSTERPGFVIELENNGDVSQFNYPKAVTGTIEVFTFTLKNGQISNLAVGKGLTGSGIKQDVWGIQTEQFVKVNTLMLSPNHWDDQQIGNKHWFFVLDGCRNDEPTRGIYNEFLRSDLDQHRKVFEVLGDRTKCQPADDQLSGLGFSSTRGDSVLVRVTGPKLQKTFNITF